MSFAENARIVLAWPFKPAMQQSFALAAGARADAEKGQGLQAEGVSFSAGIACKGHRLIGHGGAADQCDACFVLGLKQAEIVRCMSSSHLLRHFHALSLQEMTVKKALISYYVSSFMRLSGL